MKKLILILAVFAVTATASAQSKLMTVRGKDKDGKTIKVEYYQGSATDAIESVKYQLVDELQAKVSTLQSKLDAANRELKKCQNAPVDDGADDIQLTMLQNLIMMKDTQIDSLTLQVQEKQEQLQIALNGIDNSDVGRLRKEVKEKESQIKSLNSKVEKLEKKLAKSGDDSAELQRLQDQIAAKETEIDNLNKQLTAEQKKVQNGEAQITELRGQISAKESEITTLKNDKEKLQQQLAAADAGGDAEKAQLRQQITGLEAQLKSLNSTLTRKNDSINTLKVQLAQSEGNKPAVVVTNVSDTTINKRAYQRLRDSIATQDATIRSLNKSLADCEKRIESLQRQVEACSKGEVVKSVGSHSIGVEGGFGPAFMLGKMDDGWSKDVKMAWGVDVYYGSPSFTEKFPISVEVGLGVGGMTFSAHRGAGTATIESVDADGDKYQAICDYSDMAEKQKLTYLNIPIRLCIGQPVRDRVTAYFKIGVTPSINVSSKFEGEGTYSLKGYYPQWDVTIEDVPELGFGSDFDSYADGLSPKIKKFVLWGNVAAGVYVPFGKSGLVFNGGVKLDYPFMRIGASTEDVELFNHENKALIPSLNIGLTYTIK